MARTGGNRGGFNPYRNGGKFSTPGAAASGGEKVNAAIRNAAGRGTGGGGGGDDPIGRRAAAMSAPDVSRISPASREALTKAYAQVDPQGGDPVASGAHYSPDINGVATHVLTNMLQRQMGDPKDAAGIARNKDVTGALLSTYADAGITPPRTLTPPQMLALYDAVPAADSQVYPSGTMEKATAYALVSALSMGDLYTAHTLSDGPGGAGIGWGLTRQDFRTTHGIPDDGND